ncbi:MAG: NADP-dependent oxidoreductase [Acidobacteriaceae bacterium]
MKAVLMKGYGKADQLEYAEVEQPSPGAGEVLVRVEATSVNPVDWKIREGAFMKGQFELPLILGRDVAGEVVELGAGVNGLRQGDRVMGMVNHAYAEFLVAKPEDLARIPEGLNTEDAGALPLILQTGSQLIELGVEPKPGMTVLITGAVGSVGRTAVFVAKQHGAEVIAGVRRRQEQQAAALGADRVVAIDDDRAIESLGEVDAIADTVDHDVIGKLIPHLRKGGILGTVVGKPNAAEGKEIQVNQVVARPDAKRLRTLAEAVAKGDLKIPISARLPLSRAGEAQDKAEKGAEGKILLVP